jgi:hypothetical protein
MKKTIILLLASAYSSIVSAQESNITGCFGVTFGCTKQQVKDMMHIKHPKATLERDKNDFLAYQGDSWIDNDASVWAFSFTSDNKLHTASVSLIPSSESAVFNLYETVCTNMSGKYGSPISNIENYKYPYERSDKYSHGITAIKLDKAYIAQMWQFRSLVDSMPDAGNIILVTINKFVKVSVKYQDGVLIEKAIKEETEKNKSEM